MLGGDIPANADENLSIIWQRKLKLLKVVWFSEGNYTAGVICWTPNAEFRTPNAERWTQNAERSTPNAQRRMHNAKRRTQNTARRT